MENIKVELKQDEFTPIHIEFDITTKDELHSLLQRLNCAPGPIREWFDETYYNNDAYDEGKDKQYKPSFETGDLLHAINNKVLVI